MKSQSEAKILHIKTRPSRRKHELAQPCQPKETQPPAASASQPMCQQPEAASQLPVPPQPDTRNAARIEKPSSSSSSSSSSTQQQQQHKQQQRADHPHEEHLRSRQQILIQCLHSLLTVHRHLQTAKAIAADAGLRTKHWSQSHMSTDQAGERRCGRATLSIVRGTVPFPATTTQSHAHLQKDLLGLRNLGTW